MNGEAAPRDKRRSTVTAVVLLTALLSLLFFDVIALGVSPLSRDLTLYHFPLKKIVRELMVSGTFPFRTPLIEGGQPVAANPAYEVFYPPQLLILLPSYILGFKLHIVGHFYLAAIGMLLLCRQLGMRTSVAILAGAAYGVGPALVSLIGLLPVLFAMSWLPWLGLAALRLLIRPTVGAAFAAAAAMSMILIIGEPFVILQAVLLLFVVAFLTARRRESSAARNWIFAALIIVAASALAAVQLIPAADHALHSARRSGFDFANVAKWSMHPARPLELAFSPFAPKIASGERHLAARVVGISDAAYIPSIGIGVLLAALLLAGLIGRVPFHRSVALLVGLLYLLAIGNHTPLLRLLYDGGLLRAIRYPEKFFLAAIFVIILFAAFVLERVLAGDERLRRIAVRLLAAFAILSIIGAALGLSGLAQDGTASPDVLRWTALAAEAALMALLLRRPTRSAMEGALLVALAVGELAALANMTFIRESDAIFEQKPPLLDALKSDRRIVHVAAEESMQRDFPIPLRPEEVQWLTRNDAYPHIPAAWGIPTVFAYDYDATFLLPTGALHRLAMTARSNGHPAWPRGLMALSNATTVVQSATPTGDPRFPETLRAAEATTVLADAPRFAIAERVVNCEAVRRCLDYVAAAPEEAVAITSSHAFAPGRGSLHDIVERPNEISMVVDAESRTFVTAAVTLDRYWTASIDGRAVEIVPTNIAYQGVVVPAGRHRLRMTYRNPLIGYGAAVSIATLLAFAIAFVTKRRGQLTRASS